MPHLCSTYMPRKEWISHTLFWVLLCSSMSLFVTIKNLNYAFIIVCPLWQMLTKSLLCYQVQKCTIYWHTLKLNSPQEICMINDRVRKTWWANVHVTLNIILNITQAPTCTIRQTYFIVSSMSTFFRMVIVTISNGFFDWHVRNSLMFLALGNPFI